MLIKLLILLALLAGLAGVVAREVLVTGAAQRAGQDPKPYFARLRRRTKGMVVLVLLYAMAAWYEEAAGALGLGVRERLWYLGGVLITLFWLLILAGRDLRESALQAMEERRRLTSETFERIQEEIRRRKAEEEPIPIASGKAVPPMPKLAKVPKGKKKS